MNPPSRIPVLVADDHPLYRNALAGAIRGNPQLELCDAVGDGQLALDAIRSQTPAVAVLDVQMPMLNGLAVLNAVVREGLATRVLLLTASLDSAMAFKAIGAGAAGCLLKDVSADAVCDAVVAVARGETVLAREVQTGLAQEIRMRSVEDRPLLSPREHEILVLTAGGLSAPEIAAHLVLSPATVRTHLQHLYDKLGVSDRAAAVAQAMRRGVIE